MSTFTTSISSFELKSTWSYQFSNGQGYYYGPKTPSTAYKTVTVDLSSIVSGSKVTSATLSINTTRNGTSHAECNGTKVTVTGEHTAADSLIDVTSWFTTLKSSASIKFDYQSYTPSSGSSSQTGFNKCTFSNMLLTINYDLPNSTGTFDVSSAEAGPDSSITLTVSPVNESYTHRVVWTFGEQTVTQNLAAGVTTTSLAVPMSFCSEIPNATSGTGTAVLTTYDGNGTQVGDAQTYTFTVTVPASVVPTSGSLAATPITPTASGSMANIYVQGYSYASMSLPSVAGAYNSTIKSVVFSGWGVSANGTLSGSNYVCNSTTLLASGDVTLKAVVTDSRGRTCTKTLTITVTAYSTPTIESIAVNRCLEDGTKSDTGTYALLRVNYNIANISGNNASTASAYQLAGASSYTNANTAFSDDVATVMAVGDVFMTDKSYNIKVTVTDGLANTATATISLPTAAYVLHFLNGGKSIGIGQAASTTANTLTISPDWDVFIGGFNVNDELGGLDNRSVAASNITGSLSISNGGTGSTTVAGVKTAFGYIEQAVIAVTNDEAVEAGGAMFDVQIDLNDGDVWEGVAVLGIGESASTLFRMFLDEDFTTSNYTSYMHIGVSSESVNACLIGWTSTTAMKTISRFSVSRLANMVFISGQNIRGNGQIADFVIAKSVSDTVASLQIVPNVAVSAGHGSALRLTKLY